MAPVYRVRRPEWALPTPSNRGRARSRSEKNSAASRSQGGQKGRIDPRACQAVGESRERVSADADENVERGEAVPAGLEEVGQILVACCAPGVPDPMRETRERVEL